MKSLWFRTYGFMFSWCFVGFISLCCCFRIKWIPSVPYRRRNFILFLKFRETSMQPGGKWRRMLRGPSVDNAFASLRTRWRKHDDPHLESGNSAVSVKWRRQNFHLFLTSFTKNWEVAEKFVERVRFQESFVRRALIATCCTQCVLDIICHKKCGGVSEWCFTKLASLRA